MSYLDNSIKEEIDENVELILRESSNLTPPVNFNNIISAEKLKCDLFTTSNPKYEDFTKAIGHANAEKLRGVLLVDEKHIFIKDDGYEKRVNFARGHEIAHWSLDWHKAILYYCSEFDLSRQARKQLECEANYFSSRLGFLNGRFNKDLADSILTIDTIKSMSDLYELSIEACMRSGIEYEHRPCALIVMEHVQGNDGDSCKVNHVIHSDAFIKEVGKIDWKQTFPPNHEMTKILNDMLTKIINHHAFEIQFGEDKKELITEVWNNGYKIFALVTPKKTPKIVSK